MEVTGILRNWKRTNSYGFDIVWGNVYDDVKGRFRDGAYIHTSYVKEFRDEGDHYLIVTRNSVYRAKKDEEVEKAHERNPLARPGSLETG